MANTISASDARSQMADLLNRSAYGKERIILKKQGKNVAALVPIEDLELLEQIEDRLDLDAACKALKEKGEIPWNKIKKDLGL